MSIPALLVTGATGMVAREILEHLAPERRGWRIYLLTRDPSRLAPGFRTSQYHALKGDITRPDLGLSSRELDTLSRSVAEIIHGAALTRLDRPLHEARLVNVTGTENLLRLAADSKRLLRFLHLSTVCVAGQNPGALAEEPIKHEAKFSSSYQQSKYEAEQIVQAWAWRFPVSIARMSPIMGHSRSGEVRQFNFVHDLLRLFPRNTLPYAPFDPAARIDLAASDWVGRAIAWILVNAFQPNRVYHFTAGPDDAIPVDELMAQTHRLIALHPAGQKWIPIEAPRLVSPHEYRGFLERARLDESIQYNEMLRILDYVLPHLAIPQVFENHRTDQVLSRSGIARPPMGSTFAGMVRWCLDTDWGVRCVQ